MNDETLVFGDFGAPVNISEPPPDLLSVRVLREPFAEEFTLVVPSENGDPYTELLGAEPTKKWFLARGSDPIKLERALDYAWEFGFYKPVYIRVKTLEVNSPVSRVSPRV